MAKGKAESSNKATEPQTDKEKKPDEVTEPQEDELVTMTRILNLGLDIRIFLSFFSDRGRQATQRSTSHACRKDNSELD